MLPFKELEAGIMQLIDLDLNYWFEMEDNGVTGRLSDNLNIMVCKLTGRPLPEEEE